MPIYADNFRFTPFSLPHFSRYRFNHPMSSVAIRRSKHDGQPVPFRSFLCSQWAKSLCTAASDCTHSPRWRCSSGCIRRRRVALCVIHCCISHVCRESYASRRVILGNSGCARHGETRKRNVRERRDQSRSLLLVHASFIYHRSCFPVIRLAWIRIRKRSSSFFFSPYL